jgi:hypothetical protein
VVVPIDELHQIATRLFYLLENGDYVAWIGAGLSICADYPNWPETIDRLCLACDVQCLNSKKKSRKSLIEKAEECKKMNIDEYQKTLADIFGRPVTGTRRAYQLLMKLPFKGYVTTNFDPLLCESAAVLGYTNVYSYPDLNIEKLSRDDRPIFHIHGLARQGDASRGDNLILASSDFKEAYEDIGNVQSFLNQLLQFRSLLFLGCSLDDPYIYETFQRVHKIHMKIKEGSSGKNLPKRYILFPKRQIIYDDILGNETLDDNYAEHDEEERFQTMDIKVITYTHDDNRYWEIDQILQYVLEMGGEYKPPLPKPGFSEEAVPC